MALGLKMTVLMGFNWDIFVQKALRCTIVFFNGNGGEIVKFQ